MFFEKLDRFVIDLENKFYWHIILSDRRTTFFTKDFEVNMNSIRTLILETNRIIVSSFGYTI